MAEETGGEQRIFLRKASGLIRTASGMDTFIYNLGLVSVGLGVASMMYYGPAYYPGGDLIWATILAAVLMACIAFGFITWTITLPRSGGIYVFGEPVKEFIDRYFNLLAILFCVLLAGGFVVLKWLV